MSVGYSGGGVLIKISDMPELLSNILGFWWCV